MVLISKWRKYASERSPLVDQVYGDGMLYFGAKLCMCWSSRNEHDGILTLFLTPCRSHLCNLSWTLFRATGSTKRAFSNVSSLERRKRNPY